MQPDRTPSAATPRRFPAWVRWELRLVFVGVVAMNVWSPWGEPWWWRLMYLAVAFMCAFGLWTERR